MSDQSNQYPGAPDGYTPPGYVADPAPLNLQKQPAPFQPGQNYPGQNYPGQNYSGQPTYGAPVTGQFAQPQFNAPTYYQGGPGYIDATSGPRGMSLASMIIGLTSLFLVGWLIVPQLVGIVLGHVGMAKESPQGRPFSITGLITNYLALVIYGGMYAFFIFFLATAGAFSESTGETWSSAVLGA